MAPFICVFVAVLHRMLKQTVSTSLSQEVKCGTGLSVMLNPGHIKGARFFGRAISEISGR